MVNSSQGLSLHVSKCRAITALFPYAILLEQGGQQQMLDAISHIAEAMHDKGLIWYPVLPFITAMFKKPNPPSLNWVLRLISPNVAQHNGPHDKDMVARQAAETSAVSNPEEVHWSVADELLYLAFIDTLQPFIPNDFPRRPKGTGGDITHKVQALGDFRILKSYLLLACSEWGLIDSQPVGLTEMQTSILEEFCGIGMGCHREDLVKRLDDVMVDLEDSEDCHQQAKKQCRELKRVLLEVDRETVNTLTRKPLTCICFGLLTPPDAYRISPDLHVWSPSPIPMILHLESLGLLPLTNYLPCMPIMFLHPPHDLHFPSR